jgi:hypothetical protein
MVRRAGLTVIFVVLAILIAGCLAPGSPGPQLAPSLIPAAAIPFTLAINATPSRYSPVMSSTIGIRLTPVNTSGIIPEDAQFTWATNYGSFYHWGPPDFRVIELGPEFTGTLEPVYWSFFAEPGEKERPPVTVSLAVVRPSTGEILANASIRVGWEPPDGFTAVVEDTG